MKITLSTTGGASSSTTPFNMSNDDGYGADIRSMKSYLGKIRKTFRMRSARHVVSLRQLQLEQQAANAQQQQNAAIVTPPITISNNSSSSSSSNSSIDSLLNNSNLLQNLIIPLLQNYSNTKTTSSSNTNTTTFNSNTNSADCQQLILAALIEMRNSITSSSNVPSTTRQESTNDSSSTACQCIHCQLQLYIKATVTRVFENLLLAKETKEHRTAHTMTCQEKEIISKDLLESEEFSERIRLFQSLNSSSLIQVESIVRNNIELFVMISNVIPQQRSVYIASFDLPVNK